ncbi:MAG: hypothetical protein D4R67_00160 [Bacteroidetes bacterium]|nr:MAG: hypothetical protein D4R67_00160 [Bacteroidota bacterium]
MTAKEFMKAVSCDNVNIIQLLLDILKQNEIPYCVIGGLAVNAYVEPVISLDIDLVIVTGATEQICQLAIENGLSTTRFPHSINLNSNQSDIRIQLQTDNRYQDFIARASLRTVMGYQIMVARLEDVLQGKVWAYQDETRRKSKKQKDLADITRITEAYPSLITLLPVPIRDLVQ